MKKQLNFKYLLRLVAIVVAAAVVVYLVHRWQIGRQTDAYLVQANMAEEHGELARAAGYLRRFLVVRTDDFDARARLSLILEQTARTREEKFRAFLEMERVLREAAGRDDVRRKDIGLAMALRLYEDAFTRINQLLESNGADGTAHDLLGQYYFVKGDYRKAAEAFQEAVKCNPDLIPAYGRLAALLRERLKKPSDADEAIKKMVGSNTESVQAHLTAAYYWQSLGQNEKFAEQVGEAIRCDPEDPDVLLATDRLTAAKAAGLANRGEGAINDSEKAKYEAERRTLIEKSCAVLSRALEKRLPEIATQPKPSEREAWQRRRNSIAKIVSDLISFQEQVDQLANAERTARQGIENFPDDGELRLQLADTCLLQRKWDEAKNALVDLDLSSDLAAAVNYRRGQAALGREDCLSAIHYLEIALTQTTGTSDLGRQINVLLGSCYEQIGLLDRSYEAYQRALPEIHDKTWFRIAMRLASTLMDKGEARDALEIYKQAAVQYAAALIPLARYRLRENARFPREKRDWSPVEDALRAIPKTAPRELLVDRELLRADLFYAQDNKTRAHETLNDAIKNFPDSIEPSAALAFLQFREKQPESALETLAQAEHHFGDRVLFRLVRARLVAAGPVPDVDKGLQKLTEDIERFSAADRRRLMRGVAEIANVYATRQFTDRLWDRLGANAPDDIGVQVVRFDRAMTANDEARLVQAKQRIEELEQRMKPATDVASASSAVSESSGSLTRTVRAMYLIWKARQTGNTDELPIASDILVGLERERPKAAQIPLAEAFVYELKHHPDLALDCYRRSFNLGNNDPAVVGRLLELYFERRRYSEAAAVLRQLPEEIDMPPSLQQIAAEVSLRSGRVGKALELAEKAVKDDSKDYRKQMWLARVRWVADRKVEAERSLFVARDLAPEKPDAWVALVQYYVRSQRPEDAERTIEKAKSQIAKADVQLAVAQCYEITGKFDLAGAIYDEMLKAAPDDVAILKNAASLRLREAKIDETKRLLYKILANNQRSEEDVRFARRLLAIALALDPDYESSRNALVKLGLLDEDRLPKSLTGRETVDEIRDRALALAVQRDLVSKRQAIADFKEIGLRGSLTDEDQFLLAQLHVAIGDWPQARVLLASLAKAENVNPTYLAYYALGLIRESDLDEAEKWVSKLELMQRDAIRTTELQARLLWARGEVFKARDLLLKRSNQPDAPLAGLANLLELIGAGEAAEPLYKRIAAESKKPDAVLMLAMYYGRRNRLTEALEICDQARKTVPLESVTGVGVAVLYAATSPRHEQIGQVVKWLEDALKSKPASPSLLSDLAALRNLQGDYAQAILLYRQVVANDPKNVLARNNLAFLLSAVEGKHDEALAELADAKHSVGPIPTLVDTEAQVCIARGEPNKAIELLKEVVAQSPKASYYYHLVQAYSATTDKRLDARVAWKKALKLNLKPTDLHPLERDGLRKFQAEFGAP